jgi:hypothetical protein
MSFFKSTGRRPGIEALEAKQLLAGDVLVSVVGGNLIVTGDEMDNEISIQSGAEPGQYIVHGRQDTNVTLSKDCPAGSEHGQEDQDTDAENVVVVNGVRRGARIRMADGDDTVLIQNARFAGNVSVNMGEGHDSVIVGNQLVFGPPKFPPGHDPPVESLPISELNRGDTAPIVSPEAPQGDAGDATPADATDFKGPDRPGEHQGPGDKPGEHQGPGGKPGEHQGPGDKPGEHQGPGGKPGEHQGPGDKPGEHQGPGDKPGEHQGPGDKPGEHQGPGDKPGEHQGPGGGDRPEGEPVEEPSVVIKGGLRIVTGGGEDRGISVDDHVDVVDVNIGRGLQILTGDGVDDVLLRNINVGSNMAPKTGNSPSQQTSGRVHVGLGDGTDRLVMSDIHAGRIVARGGEGNDEITVGGTESRLLAIHGGRGEGADRIKLSGAKAELASVRTAAGDDQVRVIDSAFKVLSVQLGKGSDSLTMGGVSARLAALSGGPGDADLLEQLGENLIAHERIRGFELPAVDDTAPEADTGLV